ncbi:hypothetical protein INR49_001891, partial [Caranx melampygus]
MRRCRAPRCRRGNEKPSGKKLGAARRTLPLMIHLFCVQEERWECSSNMFMSGRIEAPEEIFCSGAGVSSLQVSPGRSTALWALGPHPAHVWPMSGPHAAPLSAATSTSSSVAPDVEGYVAQTRAELVSDRRRRGVGQMDGVSVDEEDFTLLQSELWSDPAELIESWNLMSLMLLWDVVVFLSGQQQPVSWCVQGPELCSLLMVSDVQPADVEVMAGRPHEAVSSLPVQVMAQQATAGRRYLRVFISGFFVAVPVTVTVLDRVAYVARVEGASMQ